MMILRITRSLLAIVVALSFGVAAGADDADEIIRNAFSPYIDGPPTMPGYKPGVAIDASNLSTFAVAIPEGL